MHAVLREKNKGVTPESSAEKKRAKVERMMTARRLKTDSQAGFDAGSQCFYGCGGLAVNPIKGRPGFGMCAEYFQGCPAWRATAQERAVRINVRRSGPDYIEQSTRKRKQAQKGYARVRTEKGRQQAGFPEGALCFHGCGLPAKFASVKHPGLGRCSYKYHGCPAAQKSRLVAYEATNLLRYGIRNPFQDRSKVEATMLSRYGVSHSSKFAAIVDKARATNRAKYGHDHPSQNGAFYASVKKRMYKTKSFTLPSGKTLDYLQGYEPWALGELLQIYSESDFNFDPTFSLPYSDGRGKQRRYYPDFILPEKGVLIEVKSMYHLKMDSIRIHAKACAASDLGWEVLFAIGTERPKTMRFVPFSLLQQNELSAA